ncbi:uncharacterized protein Eint_030600 [Encephalitozoon intestinalis ATCC 50506]|uniref:C2H2-type domain-containing protein n=1 Tax=Encephalitozoon intestinalis (strain ATCC 50506) TaxID=876142 RepID=E0S669_ENCIT|nr:uncharacterized protein Eint_030600 [Encephalitozoon intestinalis ATCC 50506]ADM11204.1 hypothetical protein Eint_030600 [Encephalitozoon intestinalis ATCC 50506]UTX44871.1 hypothetical protein GPK93_03g03980 [Encephalitozoon intestinalis]
MLSADGKENEIGKSLIEDASLFLWFVNAVNSGGCCREIKSEEDLSLASKKKIHQKIKFKAYSMGAESIMYEKRNEMAFEEDRNGFICAHCDARYVYKRCLANHLIKSHHINSNTL